MEPRLKIRLMIFIHYNGSIMITKREKNEIYTKFHMYILVFTLLQPAKANNTVGLVYTVAH